MYRISFCYEDCLGNMQIYSEFTGVDIDEILLHINELEDRNYFRGCNTMIIRKNGCILLEKRIRG